MLEKGDKVLVGLSGGKDSVVLLNALSKLSNVLKIELVAFHLNHGIRGSEADKDELFAKAIAESIGVKFVSAFRNVPDISKESSDSLEVVAREVRYQCFKDIAFLEGCNKIATAHTSSDNVETYFISLIRSGNSKFIPPVRDNIIRPLIEISTQEVLDYVRDNNLSFVVDSTNSELVYTRNFVRNKIIPLFKEKNPTFEESINKNSDLLRSYEALCELETEKYYKKNKNPLSLESLCFLSQSFAYRNVLYSVLNKECLAYNITLNSSKFNEILQLLNSGVTGQKVDLSEKVYIQRSYDSVEFKESISDEAPYEFVLCQGKNLIPNSSLCLYLETKDEYFIRNSNNEQTSKKINNLTKNVFFKYNIINSSLVARSRKIGDEYYSEGMTRNIKKHMINEKIPSDLRGKIPIVCDNEGIVWVPGLRVADRVNDIDGEMISISLEFDK